MKMRHICFLSLFFLINHAFSQNQNKVVIYQHGYYQGTSKELGVGKYNIGDLGIGDNQLSAIRVPKNFRVTLYEDPNFKGSSVTFTESADYVGGFNDKTSSIVVELIGEVPAKNLPVNLSDAERDKLGKVAIYQHGYYTGLTKLLGIGRFNTDALGIGDNQLSSIRVPKNLRATLFADANFKGDTSIFTENSEYVGGMNDLTSSIIVEYAPTKANDKLSFTGCATGNEDVQPQNEAFEKKVLELVNIERAKVGRPPIIWNPKLARAARYHAADMVIDGYFDHDSYDVIDGNKVKVCATFARINKFGEGRGENIAAGQGTPEDAMKSWMNSPGHKANILSYNESMGVGFYKNYWVQVFGDLN